MAENVGMPTHFNLQAGVTVLFEPFRVETAAGMAVACVVFIFLAILYEGLRCLRVNLAERQGWKKETSTCMTKAHLVQTLLYLMELILGYFLMLVVMTYSYWLFLAVVCGAAMGLQLCTIFSNVHNVGFVLQPPDEAGLVVQKSSPSSCHDDKPEIDDTRPVCDEGVDTEAARIHDRDVRASTYKGTAHPHEVVELLTSTV